MEAPLTGGKRKTLGGRGREWAHHCHKLLESMRELDESEHFRNPVDSLKFPVSYCVVQARTMYITYYLPHRGNRIGPVCVCVCVCVCLSVIQQSHGRTV